MKNVIVLTILIAIPYCFFGQSNSSEIEVSEIKKNLIQEKDTNSIKDDIIFLVVEKMPQYPGGQTAKVDFIMSNFNYPIDAYLNQIEGRVYVTFVVEKTGKLSDIRVLRGIGYGCNEEALRLIKLMPDWIPGKQRSEEVRVQFNFPITFKIDDKAKQNMNEAKVIYEKAIKQFNKSRFMKSLNLLNNAIDIHPYYIEALVLRGTVHKELNDIENACHDWNLAKELGNIEVEKNMELDCNK